MQEILVNVNEDAAHCVPLHPLYKNTGLSAKCLYSDVCIQRNDRSKPGCNGEIINDHADLFTKNGKPVGNVYMLGQSGQGKTTFCLHLLTLWCAAMTVIPNVWQFGQNCFHFVFYVSLRHVNRCRSRIEDMICDMFVRYDGMREVILNVLRNPKYRCLIMVDGLDEWVISAEVEDELAKSNLKGLPDTGCLSINCTILFASRHWKVELIKPIYKINDIEVELLGLTERGINSIIENILKNQSRCESNLVDYNSKFTQLKAQVQKSKSSMKVPMFVTMSVFLGLHGDYVHESDTRLFLDQLVLLIRRAIEERRIAKNVADGLDMKHISSIDKLKVITAIQQNKILSQFIVVLHKLGRVAYDDLIATKSHLVFDQDVLEDEDVLGERELDIALKVGIVSQMRAPGIYPVPKVSIEFLLKSTQEALSALYIVQCSKSEVFTSLCGYCCTIDKVMEMSNVLQYMAGMCPSISCKFSKHIVSLASNDQEIIKETEEINFIHGGRAGMLYNMQCKCYKEMSNTLSLKNDSDSSIQYHVTNVVLRPTDDEEKVRATLDIMGSYPDNIRSFALWIRYNTQWSAVDVLQILPRCCHLTTLQVEYSSTTPSSELVSVTKTLRHLQNVGYRHYCADGEDRGDVDSRFVRAILKCPHLRNVRLQFVVLDDDTLVLTDRMTELQKVELRYVGMSPTALKRFVDSLLSVKHFVEIIIHYNGYGNDHDLNSRTVRAILMIPRLKQMKLKWIEFDDDTLVLTDHMPQLNRVELHHIDMSHEGWNKFINSLLSVKHVVDTVGYSSHGWNRHEESHVVRGILQIPNLKHLVITCVALEDNALVMTDQMSALQKVELYWVRMSPDAWKKFVTSLFIVKNAVDVTIERCDIDNETRDMICKSKPFYVTKSGENHIGSWSISFRTTCKSTKF